MVNTEQRRMLWAGVVIAVLAIGMGYLIYSNAVLTQKVEALANEAPAPPARSVTDADPNANTRPPEETWRLNDDPFALRDWDPFREMEHMQRRIDQLFGDAFNRFDASGVFGDLADRGPFAPQMDLIDEGDRYVVRVNVPGATDASIDVGVEENTLTVTAMAETGVAEEDGTKVIRKERRIGRFQRSITLPEPVDAASVTSEYADGVLTVSIEKTKQANEAQPAD